MARSEQQFRIAEIDVLKTSVEDRIAGIFRFEQTGQLGRGPSLLIVADIHSSLYAYERLLDLLNSTTDQARLMVSGVGGVGQDPVARFEKLIQRLNEAISGFIEQEATPLNWKRINLFVLEMSEGHLCFSGVGSLMNVFYQKQPDATYKSFDLFGSLEQPVEVDPKKAFASIVCGDMKAGDVLIAGTNNLERLRADLQLKERLTTLPPVTAALDIRHDLERKGIPDHFVAAVVACQDLKMPDVILQKDFDTTEPKDQSTASIEKLRSAEAETTQRLAPVISPVKRLTPEAIVETAKQTWERLRAMAANRGSNSDGKKVDAVAFASLRSMNAGYGNFLTKKRKQTILAAVAAGIILIGGISWWRHAQNVAAETAAWNATFDAASDQRNRAESDLIYGNDARARTEIDASAQAISSLQGTTPEQKARLTKLTADLGLLRDKLKKVTTADSVTELVALQTGGDGQLQAPVLTADAAYAANNADGTIIKVSLATKTQKVLSVPNGYGPIVSGTEGKDNILFTTADGMLLSVKKTTDVVAPQNWNHARSSSTVDIILYASKLYSLNPEKNQVWRASANGSDFGAETAYIKATSAPLANAVGLAIDSSVYILKNDGSLLRFLSGGEEGFALQQIDPPLTAASGIWTDVDIDQIVLTDPANKRVLIFDKNGTLKSQIISDQFRGPRDLDADGTNKRMIIIDSNRLLLVPLP